MLQGLLITAVNANDFEDANIYAPSKELLELFNSITRDLMDLKQNYAAKEYKSSPHPRPPATQADLRRAKC